MKTNRVLTNASWIIGCRIVQALLNLILTMLLTRYWGPSGYGLINYAASIVAFVVPVMQLGLNSTLVQELIAQPDKEGQILGTSLTMSAISALCCMVGVVSFSALANKGETLTTIVCGLYSVQLIFQSLELLQYWFQSKLLSKYTSVTALAAYGVATAYKIILLVSKSHVYWFALSQALDYLVIGITLLVIYRKMGNSRLRFSWKLFCRLFSRSRYYIVANLMVTIFAQTDRIMLKMMLDETAVGFYSAAVTCASMTAFVFAAIIDSARPVIFEKAKVGIQEFEHSVSRLYSLIIYLSLLQCIVITVFSELIIYILYGSEYMEAANVLRLVVWYTTFSYIGSVRNIWILAEGKQKYLSVINLSGAGANVLLNYLLIPSMGIHGAALASLITQIFTNVFISYLIKPIRHNNTLMLKGLNPKLLMFKSK